jgi:hypothetical protein
MTPQSRELPARSSQGQLSDNTPGGGRGEFDSLASIANRWLGFFCLSCIALVMCFLAGTWLPFDPGGTQFTPGQWKVNVPGGWSFLFHVLMCGVAVGMMVVFPRNLKPVFERGLIMTVSVVCRAAMFGHPPSETLLNYVSIEHAWAGKLLVLLADCATIWIVLKLLERRAMSTRWALVYALNPIVLTMFAAYAYPFAVIIFAGCAVIYVCDRRASNCGDEIKKGDIVPIVLNVIGVLLILAPTAHVKHVTWILPLLAVRPTAPWLILSLTAGLSLMIRSGEIHGAWNTTLRLLEWIPVYLFCVREFVLFLKRRSTVRSATLVRSVSVVIPARNEGQYIGRCVDAIVQSKEVEEVIVVDGGSQDDTVDRALSQGARIVLHDAAPGEGGGRGGQVAAGLAVAGGDVVVIAHADTQIPDQGLAEICRVLNRQPDVIGGAYGCVIEGKGLRFWLLNAANDFRAALLGISFGDQVQFFRRRPVVDLDHYPAIPLMEDVELSKRMSEMGRQVYLFGSARVSPRSWEVDSAKRAVLIVGMVATYLLQRVVGKPDALGMYQRYYGKKSV